MVAQTCKRFLIVCISILLYTSVLSFSQQTKDIPDKSLETEKVKNPISVFDNHVTLSADILQKRLRLEGANLIVDSYTVNEQTLAGTGTCEVVLQICDDGSSQMAGVDREYLLRTL